jgi:signal transduction histidine kinase
MGFVELLDKAINDEKQKKLLGNVKKSSELLFNLINSILDLSKIESGSSSWKTR